MIRFSSILLQAAGRLRLGPLTPKSLSWLAIALPIQLFAANPSAMLSQGANGRSGAPVSPVAWQSGNVN